MRNLNKTETDLVTGGVTGNCTGDAKDGVSGPLPGETLLEYYLRTQSENNEGGF